MPPFGGFQGMCPADLSAMAWNWQVPQAASSGMAVPEMPPEAGSEAPRTAHTPPRSKKTYRAGQRLTARRLRAAQRAAEAAEAAEAPDSSGSEGQPEAEGAPRKPRRRAGVRVRRRREHAQKRREAAEQGLVAAEPLPPGLREAAEATEEVRDASSAHVKRPGLVEEQKGPESFPQSELIGEKVLITGLVQAPHLNGNWGHITAYDAASGRYAVSVLGIGRLLLKREALVLPKSPQEPPARWRPGLR